MISYKKWNISSVLVIKKTRISNNNKQVGDKKRSNENKKICLHYYLLGYYFNVLCFEKGRKLSLYFRLTLVFGNGQRDKCRRWNLRVAYIFRTTPQNAEVRIFYIICSIQFKFCGNQVLFFPPFYGYLYAYGNGTLSFYFPTTPTKPKRFV